MNLPVRMKKIEETVAALAGKVDKLGEVNGDQAVVLFESLTKSVDDIRIRCVKLEADTTAKVKKALDKVGVAIKRFTEGGREQDARVRGLKSYQKQAVAEVNERTDAALAAHGADQDEKWQEKHLKLVDSLLILRTQLAHWEQTCNKSVLNRMDRKQARYTDDKVSGLNRLLGLRIEELLNSMIQLRKNQDQLAKALSVKLPTKQKKSWVRRLFGG